MCSGAVLACKQASWPGTEATLSTTFDLKETWDKCRIALKMAWREISCNSVPSFKCVSTFKFLPKWKTQLAALRVHNAYESRRPQLCRQIYLGLLDEERELPCRCASR